MFQSGDFCICDLVSLNVTFMFEQFSLYTVAFCFFPFIYLFHNNNLQ